jgi:hypothetical protein
MTSIVINWNVEPDLLIPITGYSLEYDPVGDGNY